MNLFNQFLSKSLNLSSNDVHIWKINLQQSALKIEEFQSTLSSDEVTRANRFKFSEHRRRFIVGRGSLRYILSSYLNIKPAQIKFDYQPHGKPFLTADFVDSGIFFNLSHSQDLGLLGISYKRLIGVDIEYIRRVADLETLAQRFFLPAEYEVIKSVLPEQKHQVFFRYWTCKEAFLKATGDGLAKLENIGIDLTPNQPAQLLVSGNWYLQELQPAENFVAAVVVANHNSQFQFWQL
jgi:4'-phosphopantetheinyl transferase